MVDAIDHDMRLVIPIIAVACSTSVRSTPTELGDTHVTPTIEPRGVDDRARTRYRMHQRLVDLDGVIDAVVANRLDEARMMSFSIARDSSGPTRRAALALANATSVDAAGPLAARLTATCANCHAGWAPTPKPAPLPVDDASTQARMARHRWALHRARDGLISETIYPWRSGLEILAADRMLRRPARAGLDHLATDSADDRVRLYGAILVACSRCHADRSRIPPRSRAVPLVRMRGCMTGEAVRRC
jgi:cytochrome c553